MTRGVSAKTGLLALAIALPTLANAAVFAPRPGRDVRVVRTQALVVFDPLSASQTVVFHHEVEGTADGYAVVVPVPEDARVRRVSDRLMRAVDARLHPTARSRRALQVEVTSWVGGCAVRTVGDHPTNPTSRKVPHSSGEPQLVGRGSEGLHDWLLERGYTLAPAQAAWLSRLRAAGWTFVAMAVRPPDLDGPPPPRIRGPAIAITHDAPVPILAVRQPPFAVDGGRSSDGPPLEVGVLTEWSVDVELPAPTPPFYSGTLTGRQVTRLGADAGGVPWAFRRGGTLTGFLFPTAAADAMTVDGAPGVVRFPRTEPRPAITPPPRDDLKSFVLKVPLELPLLLGGVVFWGWRRRRTRPRMGGRLRFG